MMEVNGVRSSWAAAAANCARCWASRSLWYIIVTTNPPATPAATPAAPPVTGGGGLADPNQGLPVWAMALAGCVGLMTVAGLGTLVAAKRR